MKRAAEDLALLALGFALAKGDFNAFIGCVAAALFGGLVVLILVSSDLAVRVARRVR